MKTKFLLGVFLVCCTVIDISAQKANASRLVDKWGKSNGEVRSARLDSFFIELNNTDLTATGYIFVFCGKTCAYGEVERHLRGIELKIAGANFNRSRVVVLNGGYRDSQEVELWIAPAGAAPPIPTATLKIQDVTFTNPAHQGLIIPYDCCGELDSAWKSLQRKSKQ